MPRIIKIVILVCAVVVLLALLSPLLLGIPSGALWLPKTLPDEAARVVHPKGFSIIPPPGWVVKVGSDHINLQPGSKGMRYTPGLSIVAHKSDTAPELSQFHEAVFSEIKAYEMTLPTSGNGDVPYLRYHVFLRHEEYWYEVFYVLPNGSFDKPAYLEVPDMMMRYIRSFRPSGKPTIDLNKSKAL